MMKTKKIIKNVSILAIFAFSFLNSAYAYTALQSTDVSKTVCINRELTFKDSDMLLSTDILSKTDGIIICQLPDPSVGTLKFGTRDLVCGDAITKEGIRALKFIPSSTVSGKTSFSYIPVCSRGTTDKAVNIAITVLKEENLSPTAQNINIKTARNIAINGVFHATDPEGDELTYSVTEQPKLGKIEICLDAKNKFLYTPYQNKTGKDSFKFIATDIHGNMSKEACVSIEIERSKIKLTYADMENNGMHYQAIALAEHGILRGETIADKNFLHPHLSVTRAEFISMAMALYENDKISNTVSKTYFIDYADIPTWLKSSVTSAVNCGLVNGSTINKDTYLRPNDVITRSEAAVILNNIISTNEREDKITFKDSSSIPAWAETATYNLASINVLPQFHDCTIKPNEKLTRLDAVELIYNAMNTLKNKKPGK